VALVVFALLRIRHLPECEVLISERYLEQRCSKEGHCSPYEGDYWQHHTAKKGIRIGAIAFPPQGINLLFVADPLD
jgi:hypothetical protein